MSWVLDGQGSEECGSACLLCLVTDACHLVISPVWIVEHDITWYLQKCNMNAKNLYISSMHNIHWSIWFYVFNTLFGLVQTWYAFRAPVSLCGFVVDSLTGTGDSCLTASMWIRFGYSSISSWDCESWSLSLPSKEFLHQPSNER